MLITKNNFKSKDKNVYETLYSVANGHVGTRGSYDFKQNIINEDPGTFINGFFEKEPIQYGEIAYGYAKNHQRILRMPNFKTLNIYIANEAVSFKLNHDNLDMEKGMLNHHYISDNLDIKVERFASMESHNYIVSRYEIKSKINQKIEIESTISIEENNTDNGFDPRKHRFDVTKLDYQFIDDKMIRINTKNSQLSAALQQSLFINNEHDYLTKNHEDLSLRREITLEKDVSTEIYRVTYFSDIVDHNKNLKPINLSNPEKLYKNQIKYYQRFWNSSDIRIKGDDDLQRNVRFNIFHLNQSAARDGLRNIAAKGISSDGYEGHYFWDTEMYMLPFFIHNDTKSARKLLEYRYNILGHAKERAVELGVTQGALYSWRTINGEECSAYYPAGTAQFHINADIAFAIRQYYYATHDHDFMSKYGIEMLIEISRFWADYGFFNDQGQYEIHEVTGPDEYTALVNNNFYTNKMVAETLQFTVQYITEHGIGLNIDNELALWKNISENMVLGHDDKLGIIKQDDSFLTRERWPFDEVLKEKYPLLLNYHPLTIYRYQVNKQADTIFGLFLYRDQYTKEELKSNFDYYESITTHDSSLSRTIFSMMASYLKDETKAYQYFMDVSCTDLHDIQDNTIDGIHAANMGGTWMGMIYGFIGLKVYENKFTLNPFLPKELEEIEVKLKIHGDLVKINLTKSEIILKSLNNIAHKVEILGDKRILEDDEELIYNL